MLSFVRQIIASCRYGAAYKCLLRRNHAKALEKIDRALAAGHTGDFRYVFYLETKGLALWGLRDHWGARDTFVEALREIDQEPEIWSTEGLAEKAADIRQHVVKLSTYLSAKGETP